MTTAQTKPIVSAPQPYREKMLSLLGDRSPLEVLAQTPDTLTEIVEEHSAAVLRTRPFEGKWTPNEIIGHLSDSEWVYGYRLRLVFSEDNPTILGTKQDSWVASLRHNEREPPELVEIFRTLRQLNLAAWRQASQADLERSGQHNERGPESLAMMLQLDTVALFRDKPLDFAPGTSFHYSDSGYLLLGYIVERASGEKYEDFMRENIYERLHMENSGYDHPWIILKHRAQGYAVKDGSAVNAAYMYMDTPFGGGSTYSTVGDLLLWDQALYGEKLLSRASITAMFSPNSEKVPPEWLVGEKGGYGYGWMIEELFGRKLYVHGGLINGFSSIIMRYPEDRTLVVVLRNQQEDFPGELKKLKIVDIGKGLSAIAFGLNPPIATNR